MKINTCLLLIAILSIIVAPFSIAQDEVIETDEFAIEMLYKHFESHYTPRDLLQKAQKEALYIAAEFKKSKEAGKAAIDEFNYPFTRWNNMDGFEPFSQIQHLDKGWIEAHPNPGLHKLRFIEKLVNKFKDHSGRIVVLEGYNKLPAQPKGVWIMQYSTFIKSKTKIASPSYFLNVFVMVPGTQYIVSSIMPYRAYSIREADKTVLYLDSMVEFWSIMK